MIPIPKIIKKFRLLYRLDDGRATYLAVTSAGSEMLTIAPDGSSSSNFIGGVCLHCAYETPPCPWPECPNQRHGRIPVRAVAVSNPLPTVETSPVEPAVTAPVPVVEPEPSAEPVPEPVDDQLDRDARMVGRSVWFHGGQRTHELFQGRGQMSADVILDRAVERGWVAVKDDMIVPGTVNPAPRMPVVERSRVERAMAWGPGPGSRW
jgi:hypothetical protein